MEGHRGRGVLALVLVLAVMVVGCASWVASSGVPGSHPSTLLRGGGVAASVSPATGYRADAMPRVAPASNPGLPGPSAAPGSRYAIVNTVTVGGAPFAVAYDAATGQMFVPNTNSDNVSVIADATSRVVATIAVGSYPDGVAVDAGRAEIFVANGGTNNVSVISELTDRVVATVAVGSGPSGVEYDSGKGQIFVANTFDNTVSVIADSNNTVVATVTVGSAPWSVAYDAGKSEVFVTNTNSNSVSVISDATDTVVDTIMVGLAPYAAAYDPSTSEVYVANVNSSTVSVIPDTAGGTVTTVRVGTGPFGIAYGAGEVFVTNVRSSNVSVIADANHTVVANVGLYVGGSPSSVAYDGARHGWFVTDATLNVTVVVARGYPVTFTETGLPASTLWTLWFNGTTAFGASHTSYGSSVTTIVAVAPNGTYAFAVPKARGFTPNPASGPVVVAGAAIGRTIAFVFQYAVTFTETGLPAGTSWSVTLAGTVQSSSTASITFSQANGTYAFSVGTVSGYTANPAAGNVTVSGASASQAVTFTAPSSGPSPGPDTGLLIGLAAAAVVVVAAVAMLLLRRRRKVPPKSETPPPADPGAPPS